MFAEGCYSENSALLFFNRSTTMPGWNFIEFSYTLMSNEFVNCFDKLNFKATFIIKITVF